MVKQHLKYFINTRLFVAIAFISILLNIIFIAGYLLASYVQNSGELDTAEVNYGITLMCSDEYRQKYKSQLTDDTDSKKRVALIDYSCSENGAGPYFEKGYNEYIQTLGLKP